MSGGWAGSTRRRQLPVDWPQRRAEALERDGYRCTVRTRGVRCAEPATDVDHVVRGSDHSLENLASKCGPHHDAKSSAEGNVARWAKHSTRRPPERHPGLL